MATYFKTSLASGVGISEVELISTPSNAIATVIGLSLTNLTGNPVTASLRVNDTIASVSAYYIKNVVIPPNQSLRVINGGEKLVLGSSAQLYVNSNVSASVDVIASYAQVT